MTDPEREAREQGECIDLRFDLRDSANRIRAASDPNTGELDVSFKALAFELARLRVRVAELEAQQEERI